MTNDMKDAPAAILTCEVCGEPATLQVQDTIHDESGSGWVKVLPEGRWHAYCDKHDRESEVVGVIGPHFG